jgi:hypothetical protein
MMRDSIRLTFRMHRFELIAIAIATVVLVAAAFVVAAHLNAVGYGPCADFTAFHPVECEALGRAFYGIQEREVGPVLGFMALLPYAAGLFLGGPLIAREIERGTTRLAWSIAPSRFRWFLARMLPVVAAVLGLTFVAGVAVDQLIAARSPGVDIANSFDGFGTRGVLVAITALVMTAGAIGLGAVIGRVLPTIILALILGSLGLALVARVHERFTATEAIPVDEAHVGPGDRYVDQFFRLPDGRLVGWNELAEIDPEVMMSDEGPMSRYPIVNLVIPGERYRSIEAREALALGGIALVMLSGTAVIVQRRRPG